jgi:hypothetical protein
MGGFIWVYRDLCGFIWVCIGFILGLYGITLDLYGFIWVYIGVMWVYIGLYGFILGLYGFILGLYRFKCFFLDLARFIHQNLSLIMVEEQVFLGFKHQPWRYNMILLEKDGCLMLIVD